MTTDRSVATVIDLPPLNLLAHSTAGDAAWLDAMVDRVADILATTHGHDHNHDELRSVALGWLARPVDLLKLLLEHTEHPQQPESPDETEDHAPEQRPVWAPDHLADLLADSPSSPPASSPPSAAAHASSSTSPTTPSTPVWALPGSRASAPSTYASSTRSSATPTSPSTPVLDLRGRRRVDAYEHPETLKDHVWVQTGGDCFPFTPRTATRDTVDYDHAIPYDDTGPPGQTGTHNSGPLRRSHHRTKTHGGLTTRVVGPGRHLWRTPHGLAFLVDHTGTTKLTDQQAAAMAEAIRDGVEIYFGSPQEYEPA